jgi:hypothetical protein
MYSMLSVLVAYAGAKTSGGDMIGEVTLEESCKKTGQRWCGPTHRCVDEWLWKECTAKKAQWADLEQEM